MNASLWLQRGATLAGIAVVLASGAACTAGTEPGSTPTTPAPTTPAPTEGDDNFKLGPEGFGGLTLGLTKAAAQTSGLATGVDASPPSCGGDGDGYLVGAPVPAGDDIDGRLFFSDRGLVAIYAYPGITTPGGIGLGSTQAAVEAAYPGFSAATVEGRGSAPVPGNPDAHYRIEVQGGVVSQLSLDSNEQNCYE